MLDLLLTYNVRLLPGIVCIIALLVLLPKKAIGVRILMYIIFFILIRDTMTPLGIWTIGTEGLFWMRWMQEPAFVALVGVLGLVMVFGMNFFEKDLRGLLVWFKGRRSVALIAGCISAFIVVLPLFVIYQWVPIGQRGGEVPTMMILPIFIMTMVGNLYEETLFRGYFQGYLENLLGVAPLKAALLSALMFSCGHIFLATTVTNVGYPLLVFCLYEGFVAGLVRMRFGLAAAAITHGLAIFLLSSGVI